MKHIVTDVAVIGGGAAGLTAANSCRKKGWDVIVLEREENPGGVLLQCIHNGFGIHYFGEELTGPEYAGKLLAEAEKLGVKIASNATVMKMEELLPEKHLLTVYSGKEGVLKVEAKSVILAMGCRERARGNLGIPGSRPAGIFSAGTAQKMLNSDGILPGREAVIVGSGDIGLIMARRLSWCGIKVKAVIEIMPYPAGLSRNIAQCLEDFSIPLYLGSTVTAIHGKTRVEGVSFSPLSDGKPDLEKEEFIPCDTLLFSVGLVPENELSREYGIKLNPVTGGAFVNGEFMTSRKGVFSCGNVLHVHDLVDFVSMEAQEAAESVNEFLLGKISSSHDLEVESSGNLRYIIPNSFSAGKKRRFTMRAKTPMDKGRLKVFCNGELLAEKSFRYVKPAEMIAFELPGEVTSSLPAGSRITFTME